MAKELFKKLALHPDKIKNYKSLKLINRLIHNANLWYFNRRSVPKGVAIGIFCAALPIPFQMPLAGLLAVLWLANLPLALTLVWVNNPLTLGFIFYFNYKIGSCILYALGLIDKQNILLGWNFSDIYHQLILVWKPLWIGSVTVGLICSVISYYLVKSIWYISVVRKHKLRSKK